MSKPSERIKGFKVPEFGFGGTFHINPECIPDIDAVRREIDALHDRIMDTPHRDWWEQLEARVEALELNAKVKANPEHFSSEPKQEPKFPFNQYAEKSYPCSNEVKETKCEHDFGFRWREFKRADVYKAESPTCPYCPKQENKKLAVMFHEVDGRDTEDPYQDFANIAIEAVGKVACDYFNDMINKERFMEYLRKVLL